MLQNLMVGGAEVLTGFPALQASFTTGMTDMVANTFGMVAVLVPIGLPLFGASVAIAYAIKFIRKIIK